MGPTKADPLTREPGVQFLPVHLIDFSAARSAFLTASQMRSVIAKLSDRFPKARTPANRSPYLESPFWLTRISALHRFTSPVKAVKLGSALHSLGFLAPTFWDQVRIANRDSGRIRVTGVPRPEFGSRYSKLAPQWSLGLVRNEHRDFPTVWGLALDFEFLQVDQLPKLYSELLAFWNLQKHVHVVRRDGQTNGYEVASLCESDWHIRSWARLDGSPIVIDVFHWPEITTPARMLEAAVNEWFSEVFHSTVQVWSGIRDLDTHRRRLNADSTAWISSPCIGYDHEFDPFVHPTWATDDDPVRCPVLFWYDKTVDQQVVPVLQVDVIHTASGSFLELQSVRGRKRMKEFISVADVTFEFWLGEPHLRWDGKGGASHLGS
ncbi:hypothetical protein AYO47_08545 [Planctomyces sp. SCGC AG-212-M04]|nr:hypothetical protein AYO47_08545 [Planctomyces sp. SCGC AG-212-M04]